MREGAVLMFRIIFLSAWTLLHLYVFWRVISIPAVVKCVSRRILVVIGAVLWVVGVSRRYLDEIGLGAAKEGVEVFVVNWLGVLFLVACGLLVIDIVTLFGLALRRQVYRLRLAGLAVGMALVVTAFVQGFRAPVVTGYEVRMTGLPTEYDGLVIAVLSDTHLGGLIDGEWLAERIEQINGLQPDMVLMLGDMFEGDSEAERQEVVRRALQELDPPLGVWGVTGNHEMHGGLDATVLFLEGAGVQLLRNEWVEPAPGLAVGGVDDAGYGGLSVHEQMMRTLAARPAGAAAIFLSHQPRMVDEAAAAGIELMLSGHTHGGQIWPFSYLVGRINPLLEGRYEIGEMTVIVTRGAGTWGPRMRLWSPGEILRIVLRRQQ